MLNDQDFNVTIEEVYHYYQMGRFQQCIGKINQLLAQKPNDSRLLFIRASCLHNMEEYEEAIDNCSQAMLNGYSSCDCNYLFGKIYLDQEKYIKSEEHLLSALSDNPLRADIIAVYGFLMLKTGLEDKALKLMNEALRLDPMNEIVLHYKFYYHLAKDHRDRQIATLEKYLLTSSSDIKKLIQMGMFAIENKRYKEGKENFRQAFLLDPTNEEILSILEDLEKHTHLLFLPNRLINKIHGPVTVVILTFITCTILVLLKQQKAAGIVAIVYIGLSIYTWVTPVLYKLLKK